MKGRVINYNQLRGFGFIQSEDKLNRFFHISNVKSGERPPVGALVKFVPETGPKGPIAVKITVLQNGLAKHIYFDELRIPIKQIKAYKLETISRKKRSDNSSISFFSKVLNKIFHRSSKDLEEKIDILTVSTGNQEYTFEKGLVKFDIFEKYEKLQTLLGRTV